MSTRVEAVVVVVVATAVVCDDGNDVTVTGVAATMSTIEPN